MTRSYGSEPRGGASAPPLWSRGSRRLGLLLLLAGLVAVAAGVYFLTDGREKEPPKLEEMAPVTYINEEGGYSFSHPVDWEVREEGPVSTAVAPDGGANASFSPARDGSLRQVSRSLLRDIVKEYKKPALAAAELQPIGDLQSLIVSGQGVNDQGVEIRFLAIAIQGEEQNYAVTVFAAAGSDPEKVLPPVQAIVSTFEERL